MLVRIMRTEEDDSFMEAQLIKWGNSQGIRIPKNIMKNCGFQLNDTLEMTVSDRKIIIQKAFRHRTLEERAADFGGKLGPYEEYDWGEPVGREIW